MKNSSRVTNPRKMVTVLVALLGVACLFGLATDVAAEDKAELEKKVADLEQELEEAKAKLAEAEETIENAHDLGPSKIELFDGQLKVGGAIRANYAIGDYPESGAAGRAEGDGGNFALDTFRVNMDLAVGQFLGKLEYRWYNGYNMLHTGWLGYVFDDESQLEVGVNRVPFGPGPYGISQSWFFDQHYYVGLSDDMDLGVKYTKNWGNWTWDFGYYAMDEGSWTGATRSSSRYSYDVVNETGIGYEERNQFNLRAIYSFDASVPTDLGVSLQYGELKSQGVQDDGNHSAGSIHMINTFGNLKLATQFTVYEHDVDAMQPLGTDTLVQFGAYDFPNTVAAKGMIPAVSLSYTVSTPGIPWLDYVIPYAEYSRIMKDEDGFNDSDLAILGAAWGRSGWYIYTDLAMSNGNEFVGGETQYGDRLGANQDNDWQTRFNINFGYYF